MRKPEVVRRATAALLTLTLALAGASYGVRADVALAPAWKLNGGVTTAHLRGGLVYVGGTFTQLYTPSTTQDQFYDLITAQVLTQCARSTTPRALSGNPDGVGGLLVTVQEGDAYADAAGAFVPPAGTAIVRIGDDCRWDRQFAAPAIDPGNPDDLTVGLPVRVGNLVLASNAVVGPFFFLRAQVAAYDAVSGARLAFQFYDNISEIGFLGVSSTRVIARVRGASAGAYTLGAIAPDTLALSQSLSFLVDEANGARSWIRGQTLYRLRPAPVNTLEAFDLATLGPKAGWTAPVVPGLVDVEVAGQRVFLAAGRINGQTVAQPAALVAGTGAIDTTWTPAALTRRTPDSSGMPYVPALTQLATDGTRLYVSGDFELVAGTDRPGVAALSVGGGSLESWNPSPFVVTPIEYTKTGLLMSRPSGTNLVTRRYLAAVDRATGVTTPWNPNDPARVLLHQPGPVSAIAADDAFVYFAAATTGEVRRADVTTADVDQNWRVVVSRSSGLPGTVKSIAITGGAVYLGGEFDSLSGTTIPVTPRRALAAVATDGTLRPWAPALDSLDTSATLFRAMLVLGNTVYVGGDFTSIAGQYRPGFAAVDAVTGALTQPEMFVLGDTRIYALATDGAQIFVTGISFAAPLVGATSIPDTQLTQFGPTGGTPPTSAAFVAGRLYAGAEYDPVAAAPTTRTTVWADVFADTLGLVHLPAFSGNVEYYEPLPGNPPDPPALTAVATGNRLDVSWTRALTGGAPSSYTLYAGTAPGAVNLGSLVFRGTTSFTVNAPSGTYYLTLVARNADGASAPSNEVAVQVGCVVAPPAPGPLTFTTAGSSVSLAWGAAPTAEGYVAEAGQTPGSANLGAARLPNRTALAVAAPLGVYYVRVRAVNSCGTGPTSNEVVVTLDGTVPAPNAPTGLTAGVSGNVVTMVWTPPTSGGTPSGYQVEGGTAPGGVSAVVRTATPALVVPGAPPGTYYLRVRAFNAAGTSGPTADIVVTVP